MVKPFIFKNIPGKSHHQDAVDSKSHSGFVPRFSTFRLASVPTRGRQESAFSEPPNSQQDGTRTSYHQRDTLNPEPYSTPPCAVAFPPLRK